MARGERRSPHLYVHVPFCAHRCGYCDFVTVTGAEDLHGRYVDALIARAGARVAPGRVETVFVGGGTPSLLDDPLLARLLAALPAGGRADGGVQPGDDDGRQGSVLVEGGVTRISLGAQSFRPHLLATLERLATPDAVRSAAATLRAAGVQEPQPRLDLWGSR